MLETVMPRERLHNLGVPLQIQQCVLSGPRTGQDGLTLLEMVVTIVILAIALSGVTAMMASGISRSADTLIETRAAALGQSYLEEILARRFDEHSSFSGIPPCRSGASQSCTSEGLFGPDGEAARTAFNDVDDYHGFVEGADPAQPLRDAAGEVRRGYDNFRVDVSVRYLQVTSGGQEAMLGTEPNDLDQAQDAKLITLLISHPSYPQGWTFSAYKSNF